MMKPVLLLLSLLTFSKPHAQKTDKRLAKALENLVQNFNGDIGIFVKNLKNNKVVAINADTVFPTASMVKLPILISVMDKIAHGELAYHQELIYKDSLLYEGDDILGSFNRTAKNRTKQSAAAAHHERQYGKLVAARPCRNRHPHQCDFK